MQTGSRWYLGPIASLVLLAAAGADARVQVEFVPETPADQWDAGTYRAIWDAYGERIVAALEARTCLAFQEAQVAAIVADAVSHSGGPEHPMRLRATYVLDQKKSTLVHELGHRHLWQLEERLDGIDGHQTLYLILDLVWADVWGAEFAEQRVDGESAWLARYDYAGAWQWARSLPAAQRSRLWNTLLQMNGFPGGCEGQWPPARAAYRAQAPGASESGPAEVFD